MVPQGDAATASPPAYFDPDLDSYDGFAQLFRDVLRLGSFYHPLATAVRALLQEFTEAAVRREAVRHGPDAARQWMQARGVLQDARLYIFYNLSRHHSAFAQSLSSNLLDDADVGGLGVQSICGTRLQVTESPRCALHRSSQPTAGAGDR